MVVMQWFWKTDTSHVRAIYEDADGTWKVPVHTYTPPYVGMGTFNPIRHTWVLKPENISSEEAAALRAKLEETARRLA